MFSGVAPIIKDNNLCILFNKNSDVTYFKAYGAMSAIMNNNTPNFLHRYGVNFDEQFKKELKLPEVKLMDKNFSIFAVNKSIISDCENTFTCESGEKVQYEYVINPKDLIYLDENLLSEGHDDESLPARGNV